MVNKINRFHNTNNQDENSPSDFVEIFQNNLRFILSFIIISNFLIIFLLKFSIKIKSKFDLFFQTEIKDESGKINISSNKNKDVLLIIAHPDDEIMFYTPMLNFLLKNKIRIRILCLSNGNFDGIGNVRENEFSRIMKELKIEDGQIINDESLQDNIKIKWNVGKVEEKIKEYFDKEYGYEKIGTIVSFDENGVTKHPNHVSCCEGLM